MMQADFLGEGKFARLAVYHSVRKFVDQCTVHTMTHVFNSSTAADYNGVREVRMLATLLGIYPVQVQLVPDPLDEVVEVQVQVTADDSAVRLISEAVHFLHTNSVDLVVDIQARHILAVAQQHVNKLVDSDVFADHDITVMNLVALQDGTDHLLINLGQRQTHGLRHNNATTRLFLENNIGLRLVQTNADIIQLLLEKRALLRRLGRI